MRHLAYFTIPTLMGWVMGWITCLASISFVAHKLPTIADILSTAAAASLFIVAPTYLFLVLPYSLIGRRYIQDSRSCTRLPWWPLCLILFVFGGFATYLPLTAIFGERIALASDNPVDNPVLHLIPFVPYSCVVALLVSRMARWSLRNNA